MLSRICKSVMRLEKNFSKNFLTGKGRGRRIWGVWYKKWGTYGKKKALRRSCAAGQIVPTGIYFFKLK